MRQIVRLISPSEDEQPADLYFSFYSPRCTIRNRFSQTGVIARFAKGHEEQMAWLKKRDVAKSVEEKSKLIEETTRVLRDLGWFGGG